MSCLVVGSVAGGIVVAMHSSSSDAHCIIGSSRRTRHRYTTLPSVSRLPRPFGADTASDSAKEDVAHFPRQTACITVLPPVVPGVDPVHHAKKRKHRRAAVKLQLVFSSIMIE